MVENQARVCGQSQRSAGRYYHWRLLWKRGGSLIAHAQQHYFNITAFSTESRQDDISLLVWSGLTECGPWRQTFRLPVILQGTNMVSINYYVSVRMCKCLCVSVCLCRLLQLLKDQ